MVRSWQKEWKHIGSSLMELNVCGAIPPYNEILGGKLVALLATSPQVVHDYKGRYADKASEIASRLKGKPVCRPADLVYVGTTSLYYVGSSQYNRLKIPGKIFDTDFDIVWKKLGMTIGFGTMHISKATTMSLTEATSDGFNRINHVFGEGDSALQSLWRSSPFSVNSRITVHLFEVALHIAVVQHIGQQAVLDQSVKRHTERSRGELPQPTAGKYPVAA